jgi:hypothetical protein
VTKLNLDGARTPIEERNRRSDAILLEEQARQVENAAKIARLRELRLARIAALNKAARGRREGGQGPGVRLRKGGK